MGRDYSGSQVPNDEISIYIKHLKYTNDKHSGISKNTPDDLENLILTHCHLQSSCQELKTGHKEAINVLCTHVLSCLEYILALSMSVCKVIICVHVHSMCAVPEDSALVVLLCFLLYGSPPRLLREQNHSHPHLEPANTHIKNVMSEVLSPVAHYFQHTSTFKLTSLPQIFFKPIL